MKHGKRLTLKQKQYLKKHGLNPKEWLCVKKFNYHTEFINRLTGEIKEY